MKQEQQAHQTSDAGQPQAVMQSEQTTCGILGGEPVDVYTSLMRQAGFVEIEVKDKWMLRPSSLAR